jgi:hypothetical protein
MAVDVDTLTPPKTQKGTLRTSFLLTQYSGLSFCSQTAEQVNLQLARHQDWRSRIYAPHRLFKAKRKRELYQDCQHHTFSAFTLMSDSNGAAHEVKKASLVTKLSHKTTAAGLLRMTSLSSCRASPGLHTEGISDCNMIKVTVRNQLEARVTD